MNLKILERQLEKIYRFLNFYQQGWQAIGKDKLLFFNKVLLKFFKLKWMSNWEELFVNKKWFIY